MVHFAASVSGVHRHDMVDQIVKEYHSGDVDLHQMVADFAGITRKQAKTGEPWDHVWHGSCKAGCSVVDHAGRGQGIAGYAPRKGAVC